MKNINDFNEETQLMIKQYIDDLFIVLPNLDEKISKKKIKELILQNLEYNIEFTDELKKGIYGKYNRKEKKLYISQNILEDEQRTKLTIFHELTHVATSTIYTDEFLNNNPYIIEVLTTLLEERYNDMIVKKQTSYNRVNGYIPDFGRQLLLVYGDELLEQFIIDPLNMYKVFNGFSDDIKKFLYKKTVEYLNLLDCLIKNMASDSKVKLVTKEIEKKVADQLFFKVNSNNISEQFELIETLFSNQYYPDFLTYSSILSMNSDCHKLEKYPLLQNLKFIKDTEDKEVLIQHFRKISKKDFSLKQIRSIIMQKVFGYTWDDLYKLEPNMFEFLENEDVLSTVFNMIMENNISVDEIDKFKFRRCSSSNSKFSTTLTFDFMSKIFDYNSLPLFALFDSNDSMISIFNQYEAECSKHNITDIEKIISYPKISSQIISYLNCVSEQTAISDFYWEEFVQDLEREWQDWIFEIYYRVSDSQLSQIMISFDENKQLKFENKTICMDEAKSLIAKGDTENLEIDSK